MSGEREKFSEHAAAVARELLGDENKGLSGPKELRFGKQGSISVDLERGIFYDHQENAGGGVLWFIEQRAGAPVAGGAAVQWLRDHGYYVEDDAAPPRGPSPNGSSGARLDPDGNWLPNRVPDHGRLTATYDYADRDGVLRYQVCRYDWTVDPSENPKGHAKTFVQRRPDSSKKNGWSYTVKGLEALPYRLAELREDIDAGRPVMIVEGEKKVDMLRAQGVPATCNHGGAGKWSDDLNQYLEGADVVILPDNDDPGRSHADLVGRKLEDIARRVRVLHLDGLPDKGGIDDWLPHHDSDDLYDAIETGARIFEAAPFRSMFGAIGWSQIDDPGPKHEWLIKGILTRNEISFLLGESQSGKSFLCIDMALAIARGTEWFGKRVQQGGVVYQAGESANGVRRKRLPAYRQKHECAGEEVPFVLLQNPVDFFNSDDQVEEFIAECQHWKKVMPVPLELIVIDTFNKATPGANENDGKDMGTVLARCERVRKATGAHVMLVHHLNAGGTKARGHTSLFGNVENVVTVRKVTDSKDKDGRQIREWVVSKQKDGEDGVSAKFVLPSIEIGRDSDGDPVTSCIVAEPTGYQSEPDDPRGIIVGGYNAVLLRIIYDAVKEKGMIAPSSCGLSRGHMAVERRDLWEKIKAVSENDPFDIKEDETEEQAHSRRQNNLRQNVRRSTDFLYQKGIIDKREIDSLTGKEGWTWLTGKKVRGFEDAPGLGDEAKPKRRGRRKDDDEQLPPAPEQGAGNLPFDPEEF